MLCREEMKRIPTEVSFSQRGGGDAQSSNFLCLVQRITGQFHTTDDDHVPVHLFQLALGHTHLQTRRVQLVHFKCIGRQIDGERLFIGLRNFVDVRVAFRGVGCHAAERRVAVDQARYVAWTEVDAREQSERRHSGEGGRDNTRRWGEETG
jgi:hypothetical protein